MAEPTQFDLASAARVARVVRTVEDTGPRASPLTFDRVDTMRNAKAFRVATFTGAWPVGSVKTVTFKNKTSTPNTASVTNLFFPVPSGSTRDCGIAKDGTAWYLIDVRLYTATAVFVTATQRATYVSATTARTILSSTIKGISVAGTAAQSLITGIDLVATLNTSDCTITIGKTLTTSSVSIISSTATATLIGSTATAMVVSMTATSTFITGTATGTYLTLEPL